MNSSELEAANRKLVLILDDFDPQDTRFGALKNDVSMLLQKGCCLIVSGQVCDEFQHLVKEAPVNFHVLGVPDHAVQQQLVAQFGGLESERVLPWIESFDLREFCRSPRMLKLLCAAYAEECLYTQRRALLPHRRHACMLFHNRSDLFSWLVSELICSLDDRGGSVNELSHLGFHYLRNGGSSLCLRVVSKWMQTCGFVVKDSLGWRWAFPVWAKYFAAMYVSNHICDRQSLERWVNEFPLNDASNDINAQLWRLVSGILRQRDVRTDMAAQLFAEMMMERAAK